MDKLQLHQDYLPKQATLENTRESLEWHNSEENSSTWLRMPRASSTSHSLIWLEHTWRFCLSAFPLLTKCPHLSMIGSHGISLFFRRDLQQQSTNSILLYIIYVYICRHTAVHGCLMKTLTWEDMRSTTRQKAYTMCSLTRISQTLRCRSWLELYSDFNAQCV